MNFVKRQNRQGKAILQILKPNNLYIRRVYRCGYFADTLQGRRNVFSIEYNILKIRFKIRCAWILLNV